MEDGMNKLETTFLGLLSEKLAKTGASADFASMAALMGSSKQTPEDWIRLAEQSVAKLTAVAEPKAK
jgi:hypothetical protein